MKALIVGLTALVAAPLLVAACHPSAPTCPTGNVCMPLGLAGSLRQTPEEQLGCPSYVGWGGDGGPEAPLLPVLPPTGEGAIDREATRKTREGNGTTSCCYRWYVTCSGS